MTSATKSRIVPAKAASTSAKKAAVQKASKTIKPKVKINFVKAVRG